MGGWPDFAIETLETIDSPRNSMPKGGWGVECLKSASDLEDKLSSSLTLSRVFNKFKDLFLKSCFLKELL